MRGFGNQGSLPGREARRPSGRTREPGRVSIGSAVGTFGPDWCDYLDTVSFAQVPNYFFSFTRWGVVRPPTSIITRALFADEDMMASAHDGGNISYPKDRGKTWKGATAPPNITSFAGNAKMLFAVADSVLHHIIDTGATWTSSSVLARKIKQVSGTPSFLAVITQDNQIQVTTDTAKTWTTLPALPPPAIDPLVSGSMGS